MDVDCGSARDRLGRTLGGKYHLREVLGAGGTAVVYRAQLPDGSSVAIKILHDHYSRSEEVCRRFVREGQLGNVLNHPGTVRVFDHGTTDEGCPYLVLEYLEGESLEDRRVRCGGRLDMWETLDFCDQLLAVLEIAHAKSVVHRDIKPSNLFVMKDGRLKVLDFGIARFMEDTSSATATKTGTMVGTPAFMPPEQALSRPREVDARTDIWSVGATLFTLLSGEHVHIAETSSEHLVKAATLHARSLARALPGVPSNVEALVARCLAFSKDERWASATSMRAELSFVRDDPGRRIGTSTSPPPERTPSNPNVATVVGTMRAYEDAPTVYSEPQIPVSEPFSERRIDSVANMALSSNPGAYNSPKRKWIVPTAISFSALLALIGVIAMILAFRSNGPSQVASASPGPSVTQTPAPAGTDPALVLEEPATPTPAPDPTASEPTVAATPAGTSPHPVTTTAAMPARTTAGSVPVSAPPPVKKPGSRKDVYKPF